MKGIYLYGDNGAEIIKKVNNLEEAKRLCSEIESCQGITHDLNLKKEPRFSLRKGKRLKKSKKEGKHFSWVKRTKKK